MRQTGNKYDNLMVQVRKEKHTDVSSAGLHLNVLSLIHCNVPSFAGVEIFSTTILTQIPASPLTDWMTTVSFFSFGGVRGSTFIKQ